MAKISRANGATRFGVTGGENVDPVLLRGDRLRITDGAIEFFAEAGDVAPDLRLYRGSDGLLVGGGVTASPWVFNVQDYGAVADGVTDDTLAIRAAITAAAAYAAANETRYAEVYFPPSPSAYVLATAPVTTGSGNAVLPLPIVADTARKVTLVLRGGYDGAAMPHWNQTTGQRWGVTLRCTLTGLSNGGGSGAPSVIGGPTPNQGYGAAGVYNNVLAIIDGINISVPVNPTIGGIDLRGHAQGIVNNVAVIPDAATSSINGSTPSDWTFGYLAPNNQNNDLNILTNFSVYGMAVGIQVTEHLTADRVAIIYCTDGVYVPAGATQEHSAWFGTLSIEGCTRGFFVAGFAGARFPLFVAACSTETLGSYLIHDPDNCLHGEIHETAISGYTINGASNVRLISANADLGPQTAPSVPASTVAHRNAFGLDCSVLVIGGTVSEITVDGTTTGIALTAGQREFIPVRAGGTIAITYSVAPTWKWWGH